MNEKVFWLINFGGWPNSWAVQVKMSIMYLMQIIRQWAVDVLLMLNRDITILL